MKKTAAELARDLGGTVEGNGAAEIRGLASLIEAGPGDLTFLANPRYTPVVAQTRAAAVIVAGDWKGECPCAILRVKNPDKAFALAAALLGPPPPRQTPGVHPTAVVAEGVVLGRDVSIGAFCVLQPGVSVGDRTALWPGCYLGHEVRVGSDCTFYPHVTVRERVTIGDRGIFHNGAVIGSDGFGYVNENGAWTKIPQIGIVVVGDDVEIGANTTIDRARFGRTVIGNGVKLDNLVQIAHNVKVGEHTAIAAQAGVAGSATIGRNVQIGGQAAVVGHIEVGDNVAIAGKSGVTKSVPSGSFISGYPAMPHTKALRMHGHMMNLPDLREKVARLEARIAELEKGER